MGKEVEEREKIREKLLNGRISSLVKSDVSGRLVKVLAVSAQLEAERKLGQIWKRLVDAIGETGRIGIFEFIGFLGIKDDLIEEEESEILRIDDGFLRIDGPFDESVEISIEGLNKEQMELFLRYLAYRKIINSEYQSSILKQIYRYEIVPRVMFFTFLVASLDTGNKCTVIGLKRDSH